MSDRDRGSRRGVWSHWVPLAVTLTVATAGLAVWAWSQRKDSEEDEHEPGLDYNDGDYNNADYGDNPPYGASRDNRPPPPMAGPGDNQSFGVAPAQSDISAAGWGARMSGALRRTPSPQQFLDSTGKTVAAGVAAAGAVMGKALASIREEDKPENNPWSEEADAKKERAPFNSAKKRKTVAVVVSADSASAGGSGSGFHEHAVRKSCSDVRRRQLLTSNFQSILSHIPRHNDFSKIKLFVLIYAPDLKDASLENPTSNLPPPSLSSSFSNIGHEQAQTPGDESKSQLYVNHASPKSCQLQTNRLKYQSTHRKRIIQRGVFASTGYC
jgi:hypothetical protein